jgi:hypothetical protein
MTCGASATLAITRENDATTVRIELPNPVPRPSSPILNSEF